MHLEAKFLVPDKNTAEENSANIDAITAASFITKK